CYFSGDYKYEALCLTSEYPADLISEASRWVEIIQLDSADRLQL
ncbi:hypothetical protein scyTo_0026827, partial [Scyliorhinus torazame]|nr:hypothetical protein [Scyliorhinus torazame]